VDTGRVPDASVLIVAYKSRDYIGACLAGLLEHTRGVALEVLLLDNSGDGTIDLVREQFPTVRLIENHRNLGFAAGNNLLARHARGTYLLLLNPDTVVRDNAVGELLGFAKSKPDAGAWGGVTVLPDGRTDPGCFQVYPTLWTAFINAIGLGRFMGGGLDKSLRRPSRVQILTGAFAMIRRELWDELGGFDESFFMYREDADLCYRIARRGMAIWATPSARIRHDVGSGNWRNPNRVMYLFRSFMHFQRKHHGRAYVLAAGGLAWLHAAVRIAGSVVLRPVIGAGRATVVRQAFGPVLRHTDEWWHGFGSEHPDSSRAQTAPAAKNREIAV
jgi:N-acetylglucosaminyl-diphospho-decaprenol L-rhamnosyltransferase